ncbi:MAG: nicotinate (nicotinamide) nucleotide adenylyltransferase [Anaerolineales bacterium]|nr:nicotinate (nicotinamide) nucleotide adenylyltransferase [Anaerolineales bacterium]
MVLRSARSGNANARSQFFHVGRLGFDDILPAMASLIGIFGGTFDPPHLGHLALATAARDGMELGRVLWMPTLAPPHKQGQEITPIEHRLAMVALAVKDEPSFEISRLEIDRPAPHYAVDTVRILAKQYPGAGLVYLMGADSLRDLPTWHRAADLVSAVDFLGVMGRPGAPSDLSALETLIPGLRSRVRYVEAPLLDIAASQVRARAAAGHPFEALLPAAVYEYILTHHLYQ